jgi:pimeloyl-ACP methyl ester carboxylesterase
VAAMMEVPGVAQSMKQRVFVLVHPAWHGAWCWKKVVPLLRERGFDVFTPTFTGLGERSHLARPEIGLETHISDVVNLLKYEDLHRVVLVGHSSSDAVITGVADRVLERIGPTSRSEWKRRRTLQSVASDITERLRKWSPPEFPARAPRSASGSALP